MKKILLGLVLLIVAIIGITVSQLDNIVKTGIETAGPEAMQVPVKVADIKLSPLSGKVTVKGLEIGQPKGFGEGAIASVGSFDMKLETNSLMSNHIIIDSINIDAPLLDVRQQKGKNNFQALQDGLNLPATEVDPEAEEITVTIRKLAVKKPRILAKSDGFMKLDEDLELADFTLTNLGTDEKGLAPSEIARHVMDTLQPQITKALVMAGASGKLQDITKGATDKLEEGLGGLIGKLKKKDK